MTSREDWPPLIARASMPMAIIVRDWFLTFCMWLVFFLLIVTSANRAGRGSEVWVFGSFELFFEDLSRDFFRLRPYLWVACGLMIFLCLKTVLTIGRWNMALSHEPPPLVELPADARFAGMNPGELLHARTEMITRVKIDEAGLHSLPTGFDRNRRRR